MQGKSVYLGVLMSFFVWGEALTSEDPNDKEVYPKMRSLKAAHQRAREGIKSDVSSQQSKDQESKDQGFGLGRRWKAVDDLSGEEEQAPKWIMESQCSSLYGQTHPVTVIRDAEDTSVLQWLARCLCCGARGDDDSTSWASSSRYNRSEDNAECLELRSLELVHSVPSLRAPGLVSNELLEALTSELCVPMRHAPTPYPYTGVCVGTTGTSKESSV